MSATLDQVLEEVRILSLKVDGLVHAQVTARAPQPAASGGGAVFPPYGRSKGMPVAGASEGDLRFYLSGCRRTLADQSKSRFHAKEQALATAIEAEMAKQGMHVEPAAPPAEYQPEAESEGPPF